MNFKSRVKSAMTLSTLMSLMVLSTSSFNQTAKEKGRVPASVIFLDGQDQPVVTTLSPSSLEEKEVNLIEKEGPITFDDVKFENPLFVDFDLSQDDSSEELKLAKAPKSLERDKNAPTPEVKEDDEVAEAKKEDSPETEEKDKVTEAKKEDSPETEEKDKVTEAKKEDLEDSGTPTAEEITANPFVYSPFVPGFIGPIAVEQAKIAAEKKAKEEKEKAEKEKEELAKSEALQSEIEILKACIAEMQEAKNSTVEAQEQVQNLQAALEQAVAGQDDAIARAIAEVKSEIEQERLALEAQEAKSPRDIKLEELESEIKEIREEKKELVFKMSQLDTDDEDTLEEAIEKIKAEKDKEIAGLKKEKEKEEEDEKAEAEAKKLGEVFASRLLNERFLSQANQSGAFSGRVPMAPTQPLTNATLPNQQYAQNPFNQFNNPQNMMGTMMQMQMMNMMQMQMSQMNQMYQNPITQPMYGANDPFNGYYNRNQFFRGGNINSPGYAQGYQQQFQVPNAAAQGFRFNNGQTFAI